MSSRAGPGPGPRDSDLMMMMIQARRRPAGHTKESVLAFVNRSHTRTQTFVVSQNHLALMVRDPLPWECLTIGWMLQSFTSLRLELVRSLAVAAVPGPVAAHRDDNDVPGTMDAVLVLGQAYYGGDQMLLQRGVRIVTKPGTMVFVSTFVAYNLKEDSTRRAGEVGCGTSANTWFSMHYTS